jgi:hypothetical protein
MIITKHSYGGYARPEQLRRLSIANMVNNISWASERPAGEDVIGVKITIEEETPVYKFVPDPLGSWFRVKGTGDFRKDTHVDGVGSQGWDGGPTFRLEIE